MGAIVLQYGHFRIKIQSGDLELVSLAHFQVT